MGKVVTGAWNDIPHAERVLRWERVETVLAGMSEHEIDNHFNMGVWGRKTDCGTVGCAAGQCALDPWFKRRGFGLRFKPATAFLGGWKLEWEGLLPDVFFGHVGYATVFLAPVTLTPGGRDRRPRVQHKMVLKILRRYIRQLKQAST